MERRFLLVNAEVLPEVFLKVLRAKEMLASGEAQNISEATRRVELSRSAFYKYKDSVFDAENRREVVTIQATLLDETGALQSLLAAIQTHLERRAAGSFLVGAVTFSNEYGLLGKTETVEEILRRWRQA